MSQFPSNIKFSRRWLSTTTHWCQSNTLQNRCKPVIENKLNLNQKKLYFKIQNAELCSRQILGRTSRCHQTVVRTVWETFTVKIEPEHFGNIAQHLRLNTKIVFKWENVNIKLLTEAVSPKWKFITRLCWSLVMTSKAKCFCFLILILINQLKVLNKSELSRM